MIIALVSLLLLVGASLPRFIIWAAEKNTEDSYVIRQLSDTRQKEENQLSITEKLIMAARNDESMQLQRGRYLDEEEAVYCAQKAFDLLENMGIAAEKTDMPENKVQVYYIIDSANMENRMVQWKVTFLGENQQMEVLLADDDGMVLSMSYTEALDEVETDTRIPSQKTPVSVENVKKVLSAYWDIDMVSVEVKTEGRYRLYTQLNNESEKNAEIPVTIEKNKVIINKN